MMWSFDLIFLSVLLISIQKSSGDFNWEFRQKRQATNCKTPTNQSGNCIVIERCPELYSMLQNSQNNPHIKKFLQDSYCGHEGNIPKVCCKIVNTPVPKPPTANSGNTDAPAKFPRECGFSQALPDKIVGGKPAKLRAWPFVAAIGYRGTSKNPIAWNCGGTLISNRHVITAAHCAQRRKPFIVRLGELDLNTTADGAKHVDILVARIIPHEAYDRSTLLNDIAIIQLRDPAQFSADVQPACLPYAKNVRNKSIVGYIPAIIGWGTLKFGEDSYPTTLYEAIVEVRETDVCKKAYSSLPNSRLTIDQRVICAGGDGKVDTCQGDSGGPLLLNHRGLWYLIGVVSYGHKCAELGYPGIYTRITEYLDWIDRNTR